MVAVVGLVGTFGVLAFLMSGFLGFYWSGRNTDENESTNTVSFSSDLAQSCSAANDSDHTSDKWRTDAARIWAFTYKASTPEGGLVELTESEVMLCVRLLEALEWGSPPEPEEDSAMLAKGDWELYFHGAESKKKPRAGRNVAIFLGDDDLVAYDRDSARHARFSKDHALLQLVVGALARVKPTD